ncbi:MAG: class I SAM-dependent methyltransferase [Nanoarchaeota archaeon]|nr:class I SAM-dependent methyltransferase [Nanoarchaeota archaeon]MBU4299798.1 class I SAM-dependent methyltransferase [Nanoarchaeota archaeon]MBU4451275.1 class I SAM-dependent methyltransferase [Nanoarchaeota archaeon]MCG2724014.1 class I SAM-dependent methyltransferase [archaeon]
MPNAVKADYDKFAEEFSKTRQVPWKEVSDFLEKLPKQSFVLDIGCGNGRHIIEAKKRGLDAVGIDISKNMLKIAKKKTGVPWVLGNVLALPFKENAFDNSICIAVVHHFKAEKERILALKEIARASKSELFVSVWAFEQEKFKKRKSPDIQLGWNNESSRSANASLEAFEGSKPSKHPRFYHLFRKAELEMLAKKAELKVNKAWREGNNYWAIIETNTRLKNNI